VVKLTERTLYSERILPGFSFYLATLFLPAAVGLIALAFDATLALYCSSLAEIVLIAISIALAPRIVVTTNFLMVGNARIPRDKLSGNQAVAKESAFIERGQNLDPKAFIMFQIGVKGLVKVSLKDPEDPTPYWLFSSRHPALVLQALETS
jgi:hypothetical protein